MAKVNIEAEVRTANLALKADCYRVRIELRGKKLSLVATLPPKPTSNKRKPYQQRISLKLNASRLGLRKAKAEAIKLGDQLDRDKFSRDDWIDIPSDEPEVKTCSYWIDKFKAHVWPNLPEDKEFNWTKRYLYFGFNKLPLDAPLTPEVLVTAVLSKPETKKAARDRACFQLQRLANFAGIDVDLKHYKAGYGLSDVKHKDIPSDLKIQNTIDSIPPPWQFVFALMAIYGLRDHEAFHCTLEDRDGLLVANIPDNTKTGSRTAYPHPAEWIERWLNCDRKPPKIKACANEQYGYYAANQWKQRKAPGTPYSLRHAYAIRCHAAGVPVAFAANWMGHSPDMHLKIYQRWIFDAVSRAECEKLNRVE